MQHATKGVRKSGDKLSPEQMNKITCAINKNVLILSELGSNRFAYRERLQEHNAAREAIAEAKQHTTITTPADPMDVETELENLRNKEQLLENEEPEK